MEVQEKMLLRFTDLYLKKFGFKIFGFFLFFQESDFDPVDNCLASVLGQDVELTDEFKANYQTWLQREVYNTEIQWELLLEDVENPKSQFTI